MKTTCCTVLCLTALGLASAFGQQAPPAPPAPAPPSAAPGLGPRMPPAIDRPGRKSAPESGLTQFDLDFPGGTPKELVAAIQKAMGRPLNAIIPEDVASTKLPALKMNSVDVSQLFQALILTSQKQEAVTSGQSFPGGMSSYQIVNTSCGFRQASAGNASNDTIWYFFVEKPALPPISSSVKVCHFYSLAPYLDRGISVDDITTAIETGWKMLGDASPPTISFHKDTKLLIAVGEPNKLETIDAVLRALQDPGMAAGVKGIAPMPTPGIRAPRLPPTAK